MGYAALHLMVLMGGASGVLKILITFRGATRIQYRDFFLAGSATPCADRRYLVAIDVSYHVLQNK